MEFLISLRIQFIFSAPLNSQINLLIRNISHQIYVRVLMTHQRRSIRVNGWEEKQIAIDTERVCGPRRLKLVTKNRMLRPTNYNLFILKMNVPRRGRQNRNQESPPSIASVRYGIYLFLRPGRTLGRSSLYYKSVLQKQPATTTTRRKRRWHMNANYANCEIYNRYFAHQKCMKKKQ